MSLLLLQQTLVNESFRCDWGMALKGKVTLLEWDTLILWQQSENNNYRICKGIPQLPGGSGKEMKLICIYSFLVSDREPFSGRRNNLVWLFQTVSITFSVLLGLVSSAG
jgi:hypothetical protein